MPVPVNDSRVFGKPATKDRIMDAAERLFAEKGLDATSMRDITEAAVVNLASVNYHFGSKNGLIAAVFARQLGPLNAVRIATLDQLEQQAGSNPLPIEAILDAFIRPVVVHHLTPAGQRGVLTRLIGRCLSEPADRVEQHIKPHFADLEERFRAAVALSLPELSSTDIFWRLHFTIGAMHHTLQMFSHLDQFPLQWVGPSDATFLINQLIAFAVAGLKAPLANTPKNHDAVA